MSGRHPWLRWAATGPPLPHPLGEDPTPWQEELHALHRRWYGGGAPPAVAAVFVLQWLLQVPAHTAAHAATAGPWSASLTGLTFSRAPSLVPDTVRLPPLLPDDRPLEARLAAAGAGYRAVAEPLAAAYPATVRLGPHVRAALVDDVWAEARRTAELSLGRDLPGVLRRASCCLVYALPGCVECAGCPRRAPGPGG
ncbi:(2Fe-2S)-binding protein [Phycicoccus endophyticus]|uniref:(2Fe-2S)-binding protein n=1 Tax=Phycicoccus endophyticus TaxID=1690220 RepID=A0A7G9R0Q9_9MICO|nr:(2Fe-2S)-binding protein [Phycicoccus endophyticus]NHI19471.1 (2Fe-2S)-binding protein [Phycicoccus endophyticus]QNN49184.1 (2Fe-2S)-binding protein [Phycicoccus endophyticus]GGL39438.1 hypothetical protein GCM10012283_22420 [Phycicoccus endophyticus]